MDRKTIESAIRQAALRVGCDLGQAEDLISEFWDLVDTDTAS